MKLIIKTAVDLQAEAMATHQSAITSAIDTHIEARARAMEYNSAAHLASYVSSTIPQWADEARAFVAWRDACWIAAIELQDEAQQSGVAPSVADVIAALPGWS